MPTGAVCRRHLPRFMSGCGDGAALGPDHLLAEHQFDDLILGAGRHVDDADGLAVAQHRRPVAQRGDLEHPVRDEDHRAPGHRSASAPPRARVRRGSPAAPRSSRQGAGRRARLRARGRGRGPGARPAGCCAPVREGRGPSMPSSLTQARKGSIGVSVSRRLAATSRSGISAGSWYTDTRPAWRASAGEWMSLGVPRMRMRPAVGADRAGKDLHQRRLAGAVGAHQRMHFAAPHRQRGVAERGDGAVVLGDAGRVEEERFAGCHGVVMPGAGVVRPSRLAAGAARTSG